MATGFGRFFTPQLCDVPEQKPTGGKLERGTPIENKVDELHSIFDFVNYGYLGTQEHSSAAPLRRSEG